VSAFSICDLCNRCYVAPNLPPYNRIYQVAVIEFTEYNELTFYTKTYRWLRWHRSYICITVQFLVRLWNSIFLIIFDFSVAPIRRHLYKLYKYRCNGARADFFTRRAVNMWNSLPDSVVLTSLNGLLELTISVSFSNVIVINQIDQLSVLLLLSALLSCWCSCFRYYVFSWSVGANK